MKSLAQRAFAEKLYVEENRSYKEIGLLLEITEKTVWSWGKPEAGNWEMKRENLTKSRQTSYQEQYAMLVAVCRQINTALSADLIPHQNLITLYNNLTTGIKRTKEYEDGMKAAKAAAEKKEGKGITPETIKHIEESIFGL